MSVHYFQLFVKHSADLWAEYDQTGHYVTINPSGAALLGVTPSQVIGKTNAEIGAFLDHSAASKAAIARLDRHIQQVFETATPLRVLHEFPTPAGIQVYELTYTPIVVDGAVVWLFSVGCDMAQPPPSMAGLQFLPDLPKYWDEAIAPSPKLPQEQPQKQPIIGAEMPNIQAYSVDQDSPCSPLSPLSRSEVDVEQAETIRQSVELLWLVLDNIPQYIFWKDRNSVYLGCNRHWAEMAGIGDPEKVIGLTDDDLPWSKEQTEWYLECDRRVMETDTPMLRIKQSQIQADGRLTWRETSKLPIHDANGKVIGLLGTIDDITDQTLAEDLLRRSEAKFKQLATQEELLNRLSNHIRNSLELTTILQTVVREVRQLFNTDRAVVYQFQPDCRGNVVVEDVLAPWRSVLGSIGVDNCFADDYAELYRHGRVRVIDYILDANLDPCHIRFLQQIQVQASLIVPIVIRSDLWGLLIVHECRSPRQWAEWEAGLLRQLGDQVAIAIHQAQLYAQAHDSAVQARSQAHQLEQTLHELRQTQGQLIQTEKLSSLGQLVAGVAHEINNPVNFIYGNIVYIENYTRDLLRLINLYQHYYPSATPEIEAAIESIELDFLIEDLAKILGSVKIGADRIRQIVLSLRNFSRLDEADMKPVNLHEGIDSTLLILQHRLKTKADSNGIRLIKNYGNLPVIECYAMQLNQVFMNIFSNAIDALESYDARRTLEELRTHPSTITVSTALSSDAQWAVISIKDNGAGIPEAVQKQLFNPFFTTKPVGKGTGLGLSISHQIVVEKHCGKLKCFSEPGEGAEFRIEIPIHQSQPQLTCVQHDQACAHTNQI